MIPSELILESGERFSGCSPAWQKGPFFGEAVFTTGMMGYVESLTDPSYAGQILAFTYPLIGNYGVPDKKDWESGKIQVKGVVMGSLATHFSHHSAKQSLLDWLKDEKIPLISDVDTRALTKRLRAHGVALGAIAKPGEKIKKFEDPNETDLVRGVTLPEKKIYGKGKKTILAVDCGMKENIVRSLLKFDVRIVRVPYNYDYSDEEYDGLFISNGPGDPEKCKKTIEILRKNLERNKPVFGICLGAQLLALAIGGSTYKLKFGHRGQNQPCLDLEQNKCILTSQNHGYAIDDRFLPTGWQVLLRHLNDNSVEGIIHKTKPYFAVQFHPESSPGPEDAFYFFERFYSLL